MHYKKRDTKFSHFEIILFAVFFSFLLSGDGALSADGFLINKTNFTMSGIKSLLIRESKHNKKYTVDCAGSWNIIWPEVKSQNPWAMLAYSVDLKPAVQNQPKSRNISVRERADMNRQSILANLYYLNFDKKGLLSEFEETFRELPRFPSKIHIIGRYFGTYSETERFVVFVKCIKNSYNSAAADVCFDRLSEERTVLKFDELITYVDDESIKTSSDIICLR